METVLTARRALYALAATILAGTLLSAMLTHDPRWLEWHLSRLGEGGGMGAWVFNGLGVVSALIMQLLAWLAVKELARVKMPAAKRQRASVVLGLCLGLIAACMLGVALFPFDAYPVIHNTFGYGTTVIFVAVSIVFPLLAPLFDRRFRLATYAATAVLAVLFGIYFAHGGTGLHLLYIELLGFVYFFAWMFVFTAKLQQGARY